MREYNCENCGKKFYSYKKGRRFCSVKCVAVKLKRTKIWNNIEELKVLYKEGKTTQEIADITGFNRNTIKTVFRKIGIKARRSGKRKGIKPWNKGKPYYAIRKEKNPNWKGGTTSLTQQIRHCVEMLNWKRQVLERDNYTCQICGEKATETDHYPKEFYRILKDNNIKSYQDAQKCDELWNLNNGRALCLKCHNKLKKFFKRFSK